MTYCTPSTVREMMGITSTSDDALITRYIATASRQIDAYTHRTFSGVASTRYVDAVGEHLRGSTLYLDAVGELASITSIVNGDGVTVASGEYITEPRNVTPYWAIRLLASSGKSWTYSDDWEGAIAITGVWAYSETPPADIRDACAFMAAFYYRQKDQPFTDVTAVEAGIVVRPVGIPAHIKVMLDQYRKP